MKSLTVIRFALGLAILPLVACAQLGMSQPPATAGQVLRQANGQVVRQTNGQVVREAGDSNARSGAMISASQARALAVSNNLTGYRALPPGIQRNLARGKPLPPGIAKRMVPGSMLGSLPVRDGHEWRVAGQDLVLIDLGTQLVVDLLGGVFR